MPNTRIAFNGAFLRHPHCGMGDYTRNLLRAFSQVSTYSGVPVLVPTEVESDLLVPGFSYFRSGRFATLQERHAFDQRTILEFARKFNPQILHSMYAALPAVDFPGLKVVTVGDMIPNLVWRYASASQALKSNLGLLRSRFLPLISRVMNERGIKRADAILTFSQCSKRDIIHCLGVQADKVRVVPIGVDPNLRPVAFAEARPVLDKYGIEPPYLLYVGGFAPHKNVLGLLNAFACLPISFRRSAKLVMVGINPPPGVQKRIQSLGLANQVVLPGAVDTLDRPAIYSSAIMLVFPSLYEGFGLPPLEAMSCGCPVVTSSTSSIPEVVGDAAIQVNPKDSIALSEAMARILDNNLLATELRAKGLERSRLFSWDRCVSETANVYDQLATAAGINW